MGENGMKALVLALALLVAQTLHAAAYVVCDATPHRAACLGPRVGSNYGWRGWGWRGAYGGPYGWRAPYAGPPGPYGYAGWRGPYGWGGAYAGRPSLYGGGYAGRPGLYGGGYAGPYFRPGPYF
jgi:hypothetical protein